MRALWLRMPDDLKALDEGEFIRLRNSITDDDMDSSFDEALDIFDEEDRRRALESA